ncbi:transmembrane protein 6/97 [Crucibulum laeve]|uniref:Efficient mitochondria targeting-associated protein 19 n=1 Tax=Crucibulum laeve TaxID=68775 RepID=A0A5C3M4T8_9AGAR|nr:transmembrane protein 6/97 [Crucibulum laeve]
MVPLTARPLDFLYFLFFAIHIPASLLIDLQYLYPSWLVPNFIRNLLMFYVKMSNDPLIGGLAGYFGNNSHLIWLKSYITLEAIFQFPVFILGMLGLYKGSRSIYVLLLVYAASTATTALPCVMYLLQVPHATPDSIGKGIVSLSFEQRLLLLSSYIPFFLIPLLMTVDMAMRVLKLVKKGTAAEEADKWK